jgi:Photosynthesis system II assembly factor YCF48
MTKVRVVLLVLAGILALSYCSQARAQAKLLGDDTGWAIRVGLQWTNNDGKDWQQITPKAVLDGGWSLVNAFFLNTSNGWVLMQKGWPEVYGRFAVATTDNGGLSWSVKPVNLPSFYQNALSGGGTIDFVDPMHGWVNLSIESSPNFNSGALFSTDDGGETWHQVKNGPRIAGEVRFITLEEGWVQGGPGDIELYGTQDGGQTWKKVNLPPPPGVASTTVTSYYLPKFRDPSHGYLPVFFSPNTPSGTVVRFQTLDGGKTWEPTKRVIQYPGCTSPASMPVTVADSTLFVVEQTGLYKTALLKATPDGQVETLPAPFAALGYGITLSFSNSAHGWAHGGTGEIKVTTDGGQTWTNPAPVRHGMGHRMQPMKSPQR